MGIFSIFPLTNANYTDPRNSPCGWTSLTSTFTDATDDVARYLTGETPDQGTLGDYHDEVDIVNITLVDSMLLSGYLELFVEFVVVPVDNGSYAFTIYIDTNNDDSGDYFIQFLTTGFTIQRLSDNQFFNFASEIWSATPVTFGFSDYGTGFVISKINVSVPTIQTSRVAVIASASFGGYYYADFTPLNYIPLSGIPAFSFEFVLLSFLTILGLILILDRKKVALFQK